MIIFSIFNQTYASGKLTYKIYQRYYTNSVVSWLQCVFNAWINIGYYHKLFDMYQINVKRYKS